MAVQKICPNKCLFWLLFACLVGFSQPKLSAEVSEKSFRKLTHKEKMMLKHFFATAIKIDQLGHVLFFSTKPACFFIVDLAQEEDAFTKAWNIWKSKEHLFQYPSFIVYEEIYEKKAYVYFINKQTLLSQFSCKEALLKKLFSESFSIKDLIVKLEQNTFDSLICKNQVLLGMLLGYGIESALNYPQYIAPVHILPVKSSQVFSVLLITKLQPLRWEMMSCYALSKAK